MFMVKQWNLLQVLVPRPNHKSGCFNSDPELPHHFPPTHSCLFKLSVWGQHNNVHGQTSWQWHGVPLQWTCHEPLWRQQQSTPQSFQFSWNRDEGILGHYRVNVWCTFYWASVQPTTAPIKILATREMLKKRAHCFLSSECHGKTHCSKSLFEK